MDLQQLRSRKVRIAVAVALAVEWALAFAFAKQFANAIAEAHALYCGDRLAALDARLRSIEIEHGRGGPIIVEDNRG